MSDDVEFENCPKCSQDSGLILDYGLLSDKTLRCKNCNCELEVYYDENHSDDDITCYFWLEEKAAKNV